MDVSSLISLYSSGLLNQSKTNTIDSSNSTGDFASYLLNALGTTNTSTDSLLSANSTNLIDSLSSLGSTDVTNSFNSTSSNQSSLDNTLGNMLTSTFQSQLTSNLLKAKTNMQTSYTELINRIGDNASPELLATKGKLENNIQVIDKFLNQNLTNNSLGSLLGQSDANNVFSSLLQQSTSLTSSYEDFSSMFSSNDNSTSNSDEDTFGNMLTSSFQTQLLSNLTLAKSKMQKSYVDYISRVGENPSEVAIARMEEMKSNIQSIDTFMTSKINENSAKQAYSQNSKAGITAQLNSTMNGLF